ncbi:hypothetical protein NL676_005529 [Syzygium grande]|nr:hypothetical protein NL676_005529 [Syzygium grande]
MRWALDHELMPGDHIDVPSAPFREDRLGRAEIHVYPRIAGEHPFHMYGYGEHQIVYPNGVKAVDVAGSIDYWSLIGSRDVSLDWKGKVIKSFVARQN